MAYVLLPVCVHGRAFHLRAPVRAVSETSRSNEPQTTLLLVNRRSRNGSGDLEPVVRELARGGGRLCRVESPAELRKRLDGLALDSRCRVVLAGGDGTINACLEHVVEHPHPVGIVPLGTANDLARTLGLPADPVAAAAVIARGRTRAIDVARVNDRYFINAAGLGFSSELTLELDSGMKKLLGRLAYPFAAARRWRKHKPFTIEIDGGGLKLRRKVIQATIANGKYYGGGMVAHADARIDDGLLDVLLIEAKPAWQHLLHITSLKTGVYDLDAPFVVGTARSLEIGTRRPKIIATDGELATRSPASLEVLPGALTVFGQ